MASSSNKTVNNYKEYYDLTEQQRKAYVLLLSGCPKAFDAKITTKFGVHIERAIEEFRRFIALKFFFKNTESQLLSPTTLIESLWQSAVLHTQFYAKLQTALRQRIHHRPVGVGDMETAARSKSMATTQVLFRNYFREECLAKSMRMDKFGKSIVFECYDDKGRTKNIRTTTSTTVLDFLQTAVSPLKLSGAKLHHEYEVLELDRTLGECGIKNKAYVYVTVDESFD
ncbi:hypothetical protein M7I_1092 [Glarea lozoyensis 74030]|uniref:Ubiquitin-like domain-containing protein n=1 Tax=Glarea lozoyensis (strain ATCC 74030 / MF5533) TaxID=1104152 RepID=H0EF54_GLAL7|nr:hypothetical protein M7I_1092 [Glarea lozoyensis 74030]